MRKDKEFKEQMEIEEFEKEKSMDIEVIKNKDYVGTDEGRLYLDGISIKWDCPCCKNSNTEKMVRDSYMYDSLEANKTKEFELYCAYCDNTIKFSAKLNVDFEIVTK